MSAVRQFLSLGTLVYAAGLPLPPTNTPVPVVAPPPATGGAMTAKFVPVPTALPNAGIRMNYVGPTANITEVANHIQVQAKSLDQLGHSGSWSRARLRPVTISIAYLSPWPVAGNERKTQTLRVRPLVIAFCIAIRREMVRLGKFTWISLSVNPSRVAACTLLMCRGTWRSTPCTT